MPFDIDNHSLLAIFAASLALIVGVGGRIPSELAPLEDRSAPGWVRGFKLRYCTEFAKPPRVISARTVSPTLFCLMCFVPWPTYSFT